MTDREAIEKLTKKIDSIEEKIDAIMKKFDINLPEKPKKEVLPYIPAKEFKLPE